jgi:hypothetical protein
LTIKFTRHTAVPLRSPTHCHPERSIVSRSEKMRSRGTLSRLFDLCKTTKRRENLMGLDPAHRMQHRNSLCELLCPLWSKLLTLITPTQNHRRNPRRIPQQVFFRHS